MKILIVDDHPLFRAGFQAVLEQSALEAGVLSVSSVTEALQILQRDGDIGLVLLDIHLKGDDGFNALKIIGERFPTTNRGSLYWPHRSSFQRKIAGKEKEVRLSYFICPEGGKTMTNISVFCHEFGHMLGLPDLYARPENPGSEGAEIGRAHV